MLFLSRISKNNGTHLLLFLYLFSTSKVQSIFLAYSFVYSMLQFGRLCHRTVCISRSNQTNTNNNKEQCRSNNDLTVKIANSVSKKENKRKIKKQDKKVRVLNVHGRLKCLTIRQIISTAVYRRRARATVEWDRSWAICFKFTHSIGTKSSNNDNIIVAVCGREWRIRRRKIEKKIKL